MRDLGLLYQRVLMARSQLDLKSNFGKTLLIETLGLMFIGYYSKQLTLDTSFAIKQNH